MKFMVSALQTECNIFMSACIKCRQMMDKIPDLRSMVAVSAEFVCPHHRLVGIKFFYFSPLTSLVCRSTSHTPSHISRSDGHRRVVPVVGQHDVRQLPAHLPKREWNGCLDCNDLNRGVRKGCDDTHENRTLRAWRIYYRYIQE